jgi:hypothetical protein
MTRSILSLLASCLFVGLVAGPGCQPNGVGDPCTPDEEYVANFAGFSEAEVNVESKSFQCRTRLCLANHFRGRVSCPYGQDATGASPAGLKPDDPNMKSCVVPGTQTPIDPTVDQTGVPLVPVPKTGKSVPAQCVDRKAALAVYCSCRCAADDGTTTDGANYCTCPDGYSCKTKNGAPLVSSIGAGDTGLTGFYCYKTGTDYDSNSACALTCDPSNPMANCDN